MTKNLNIKLAACFAGIKSSINKPLAHIDNVSFESSIFSESFKMAEVAPL